MHSRAAPACPLPTALVARRLRLAGVGGVLPLPDRIADNETYMHTARTLAADMAGAIRNPKKP
ncbi:MAG: hypothetical protein ABSE42_05010 [Bryobacteraceae bacterium]